MKKLLTLILTLAWCVPAFAVKTNDLPSAPSVSGSTKILVTVSGTTYNATADQLLALLSGTGYAVAWSNVTGEPLSIAAIENAGAASANTIPLFGSGSTASWMSVPLFSQTLISSGSSATAVKTTLSLQNVDNTSDANKPVSSAQQSALDLKQDAATAVTLSGTQTLANKTISGSANSLSAIPNSALVNSGVTIAIGSSGSDAGISGGALSLGTTATINLPTASAVNRGLLSASDFTAFQASSDLADTAVQPTQRTALESYNITLDRFSGTSVSYASSGTRVASPGPGVWTFLNVGSNSWARVNAGALSLMQSSFGSAVTMRGDAQTIASGLSVQATFVPRDIDKPNNIYSQILVGFSPSSAGAGLQRGTILIGKMSDADPRGSIMFSRLSGTNDSTSWSLGSDLYTNGEKMAVAVRHDSPTLQSYWVQGGRFETFGAVPGSNTWFPIGVTHQDLTGLSGYPHVGVQGDGGEQSFSRFQVLSNWTPDNANVLLDYERSKQGVHCPTIEKDPASGRIVCAWNNGVVHTGTDVAIRAAARNADGSWTDVQTIVAPPGAPAQLSVGSLSKVGNELWLTTFESGTTTEYGELYHRTLSVNPSTGVITPGSRISYGISGTDNYQFSHIVTLDSGRLLMAYQNVAEESKVARSDNGGSTWTTANVPDASWGEPTLAIESDGAVACYFRTPYGYAYYSRSSDSGVTWPTPTPLKSIPQPNTLLTGSRLISRTLDDGRIGMIGNDDTGTRRRITFWTLGDEGVVLSKELIGDLGEKIVTQYPDFIVDNGELIVPYSRGDAGSVATSINIHSRRFDPPQKPAQGGSGVGNVPEARSLMAAPDPGNFRALTFSSTVTTDASTGSSFYITVTGNLTLANPLYPVPGQTVRWGIKQGGSGGYTLSLGNAFRSGPFALTPSRSVGAVDYLTAAYNPKDGKWDVVSFARGDGAILTTGTARMGTAILSSGTAQVLTSAITGSSGVHLTRVTSGTSSGIGSLCLGTVVSGTSLNIESLSAANAIESGDFSTVRWTIIEPAP